MIPEAELNLTIPTDLLERFEKVAQYDEKPLDQWAVKSLQTSCKTLEVEMADPLLRSIWKRKR